MKRVISATKEGEVKSPQPRRVKNKNPAPLHTTAEQILREPRVLQEAEIPSKHKITDAVELSKYKPLNKLHNKLLLRREFEDLIRLGKANMSLWVKYAQWEESQKDFSRARSIWERALAADNHMNMTLWLKYGGMEMRNKFINHARNVWDRAVSILPRIDQLWYMYIHMEEMEGNVAGARQIFERWMVCESDHHGWSAYISFELRYKHMERARAICEKYVQCHPTFKAWTRYAEFEAKNGEVAMGQKCFDTAMELCGEYELNDELAATLADPVDRVEKIK